MIMASNVQWETSLKSNFRPDYGSDEGLSDFKAGPVTLYAAPESLSVDSLSQSDLCFD